MQFSDTGTMIVLVDDNSLKFGTVLQAAVWPHPSLLIWHDLLRKIIQPFQYIWPLPL